MQPGFYDNQGPGQNLSFFLITSGLDLDPRNGTVGLANYSYIKKIISNSSEILFEAPSLRSINNVDISKHLPAYDSTPRTLYQILFGLSSYNNSWNSETLSVALANNTIYPEYWPSVGEYSINPYELDDKDYGIYQYVRINPTQAYWSKVSNFKVTEEMPGYNDGTDRSIWAVLKDGKLEFYIKVAFQWILLNDYAQQNNIAVTASSSPPSQPDGKIWIKLGDLDVYKFNGSTWDIISTAVFSNSKPTSFVGDLVLAYDKSAILLYEYNNGKYNKAKLSKYIIRNKEINSTFQVNENNFIIEDGNMALIGGIASYQFDEDTDMVKVYQDGNFIGNYNSLDFQGPTVTDDGEKAVISFSPNQVDLTIQVVTIDIIADNQTIFDAPPDLIEILNVSVNGIDENNFSYSQIDQKIIFNPTTAKYHLEMVDKLILTYVKN